MNEFYIIYFNRNQYSPQEGILFLFKYYYYYYYYYCYYHHHHYHHHYYHYFLQVSNHLIAS